MLKLVSKISIAAETANPIVFDFVNEVDIISTWERLTDTCLITIPRKITFKGEDIAIGSNAIFYRGQSISIQQGYDGALKTVFQGYISRVYLTLPLRFECEDEMYNLKKTVVKSVAYDGISLSSFLSKIFPSSIKYTTNGFEFSNLGKLRLRNNPTLAQVLEMLKREYKIYSYYQNGIFNIGLPYIAPPKLTRVFNFEKNIINDSQLEYTRDEDVKIKVRAVSIDNKNKKVEYYYPSKDVDGQTVTYHVNNVQLADLQALAKRYYEDFKVEGYKGSFETFGEPMVNHGDAIQLISDKLPERNGVYICRSVRRRFGMGGYRQIIELDKKIEA